MRISIIEQTFDYRGDHSTDIAVAHEYIVGETVEHLIDRCLRSKGCNDRIELRIEVEKPAEIF